MEYKKHGNTFVVRLDRGDEVVASLKELALHENIKLAQVSGLGATDEFTVGCYSVQEQEYYPNTFTGSYEIVSLIGNITLLQDQFYLHVHMGCADAEGHMVGGHLTMARISGTGELFVTELPGTVHRQKDPLDTGLLVMRFAPDWFGRG